MKTFIGLFMTLGFSFSAQAGIFDGTPLDPRSAVEKCQDFVEKNFSSGSEFLASCGRITTDSAFKCIKTVSKNTGGLSKVQINACSFVNTKEAEKSIAATAEQFPLSENILIALTFSDTKPESKCVEGVVERLSSISATTIMECNQEGPWDLAKRVARIYTM